MAKYFVLEVIKTFNFEVLSIGHILPNDRIIWTSKLRKVTQAAYILMIESYYIKITERHIYCGTVKHDWHDVILGTFSSIPIPLSAKQAE